MARKHKERRRQSFIRRGSETNSIFLEDLRGMVWNSRRDSDMDWKTLAIKASLHKNTVAKFAYGEVTKPNFRTVFNIAEAIGVRLKLGE